MVMPEPLIVLTQMLIVQHMEPISVPEAVWEEEIALIMFVNVMKAGAALIAVSKHL